MRAILAAAIMAALPGAAAQEAQQFDLLCTYGKTPVRYRVDIARGEACEAECSQLWKMGAVSTGEIRLKDTPANYPEQHPAETITINRQTGDLLHWVGPGRASFTEKAQCEPAAFSGFPDRKF